MRRRASTVAPRPSRRAWVLPISLTALAVIGFLLATLVPIGKEEGERAARTAFSDYLRTEKGLIPAQVRVLDEVNETKMNRARQFYTQYVETRYQVSADLATTGRATGWVLVRRRNKELNHATVEPRSVTVYGAETIDLSIKMSSTNSAKSPPSNR
ncbi:hypothetical protein EON79_10990 [bacterium]|nr:MAG: hypothetical protein EON79_10990 [bacterium]